MQVQVRDNNVDQALRALKKKLQREGVFREMKLRQHYEKPSKNVRGSGPKRFVVHESSHANEHSAKIYSDSVPSGTPNAPPRHTGIESPSSGMISKVL